MSCMSRIFESVIVSSVRILDYRKKNGIFELILHNAFYYFWMPSL